MFISSEAVELQTQHCDVRTRSDPRVEMTVRLPHAIQPFLTWLTAKPAPGETARARSPLAYVWAAVLLTAGGFALTGAALLFRSDIGVLVYVLTPLGMIVTSSGLGLFQVGIFHHCAHNKVFRSQKHNRTVGRLISALLLFKCFDSYKREHTLHHNPKILFTMEDEFSDFVVNICSFSSGMSRERLWRRLILQLMSPKFHASFLYRRVRGSLGSPDRRHNLMGITVWGAALLLCALTHTLIVFAIAWILPVTVLLQIATVFRILCEHRVPDMAVIEARGHSLISQATAGVFPGAMLPARGLSRPRALWAWSLWWADMLTIQLFVRVFVLVGDAPCHDFHHRRPGRGWTDYIHGRQEDMDEGCPGYPLNYVETWGLFRAIDENFQALAKAPAHLLC
jgi:fatty acid desaturase